VSIIDRFKDATIGFSGYPRLVRDRASGFGFMALVLALVMLISGAIWTVRAKAQLTQAAQSLANGPDFSLQNGEVNFSGTMPYKIKEENGAFLIVDTTGQTTPDVLNGAAPGSILITKNAYHAVSPLGKVQSFDLSQLPVSIGKSDIVKLLNNAHWYVIAAFVLLYPFQLGFKAFDAVILGLFATMTANSMRRKLPFDTAWKIGLYALTMPTLIQWIFPGFSTLSRIGFGVWWLLGLLYAVMGTRAYLTDSGAEE